MGESQNPMIMTTSTRYCTSRRYTFAAERSRAREVPHTSTSNTGADDPDPDDASAGDPNAGDVSQDPDSTLEAHADSALTDNTEADSTGAPTEGPINPVRTQSSEGSIVIEGEIVDQPDEPRAE